MEERFAAGALQGVVIIDFSQEVAGPYCTRLAAGLGAEVIKIEKPGEGDVARQSEPFLPGSNSLECSALFHHLNAGKKSITINLESSEGRDLVKRLVCKAQIAIENFAPGYLGSIGLDYHSCSEKNPGLVITSISPFGQHGPYRDYVATDLTSLAMGGLLYTCGETDREPIRIGGMQASYLAGLHGAIATTAALLQAEVTGEGQWIDVSVMECVASVLEATTVHYSRGLEVAHRQGNRHGQSYPMTILPCKDGYIGAMIAGDENWELFARLVDKEELLESRFVRGKDRFILADEIDGILRPYLMNHTRAELFHWAQELRLPFSMVLSPGELLSDPQHRSRNFFRNARHPVAGDTIQLGPPFRMKTTPWQSGRAPLLGEHTEEVLQDLLNLDERELSELRREGAI